MTLVFGAIGLACVHFVLPRLNRLLGCQAWDEARRVRRWNYGVPLPFVVVGAAMMTVGAIRLLLDALPG